MKPNPDCYETLYILATVVIGMLAPTCFLLSDVDGIPAAWSNLAQQLGVLALIMAGFLAACWPFVEDRDDYKHRDDYRDREDH